MKQKPDESAYEFLGRVVKELGYEYAYITEGLPSVAAIIEFVELWDLYETEYFYGILEAIENGADPKPLKKFIKKYNLPWQPNLFSNETKSK